MAVLLIAALGGPAWAAPPPVEVENLRIGFDEIGRSNRFKIGAWVPLTIQLRAPGAAGFVGFVEVIVPDDDDTPSAFRQRVEVPAHGSQRVVTYARPGSRDPDFTIRLLDDRGRRVAPDVTGSSSVQINPIDADDDVVLAFGKPQGVEQVPGLAGFQVGPNGRGGNSTSALVVAGLDALGGHLPGRWYGYDAATAVVLDTNDRRVMDEFSEFRGTALEDWVKRGGHLVVAVGSAWQSVEDSFLAPMLPVVATGQEQVGSLAALETFAGAGATKQIMPEAKTKAMVTKLGLVPGRSAKVLSATGDLPLVVRGSYGFGRVTVIGLDVDQRPFADWADRPLFWIKALDLRPRGGDSQNNVVAFRGGGRRIMTVNQGDLVQTLRQALEQFPGVKLVPFGWVAFFIFLYILLIGPGDYFFLKKVLKRMEFTWITFPVIVVTVSLLAYYAAYVVKGNELRVNKIDVVDIDQPSGMIRGSAWMNIFSPQNRDYDVSVVPISLEQEVPASTEPTRAPGTEVMVSWFGNPQTGFGGMGQGGRLGFSSGGYEYQPIGAAESLSNLRIAIWSTKCLTARWFGTLPQKFIDGEFKRSGHDGVEGTLTNHLDIPLNDVILAYGRQVYELSSLAPGEVKRIDASKHTRHLTGLLSERVPMAANQWNNPTGPIDRANLMLSLMFSDAIPSTNPAQSVSNSVLRFLDLSGELALDRPMLVARVNRAASRLNLGQGVKTPVTEQTTMLRVVFSLTDEPAAESKSDAVKPK
jgi:hypothetical protein